MVNHLGKGVTLCISDCSMSNLGCSKTWADMLEEYIHTVSLQADYITDQGETVPAK